MPKMWEILQKICKKIAIAKSLIWFAFNLCSMLPPFRGLRNLFQRISKIVQKCQKALNSMANQQPSFRFIFQVYKQLFFVLILGLISAKVLIYRNKSTVKYDSNRKGHIRKQLDQISQKSIRPNDQQKNERKYQDIDSCCQQLHRNLNKNHNKTQKTKQEDKIFSQIFKCYQHIDKLQSQLLQQKDLQSYIQNGPNKTVNDNSSTHQGNVHKINKNIKNSVRNQVFSKRDDQLNRSSVL